MRLHSEHEHYLPLKHIFDYNYEIYCQNVQKLVIYLKQISKDTLSTDLKELVLPTTGRDQEVTNANLEDIAIVVVVVIEE